MQRGRAGWGRRGGQASSGRALGRVQDLDLHPGLDGRGWGHIGMLEISRKCHTRRHPGSVANSGAEKMERCGQIQNIFKKRNGWNLNRGAREVDKCQG